MTKMNELIPSHFESLFLEFLLSLLEVSPKGLPEIYEFAAQYFTSKLLGKSSKIKKNEELFIQRDVPNSEGKKQFLLDFSYDSVLILKPKLCSQVSSFDKNIENLFSKNKPAMNHLNDFTNQWKQERNLLRKHQAFQKIEEMNPSTNLAVGQYESKQTFLEEQEKLKKARNVEKIFDDGRQDELVGFLNKDSKIPKEQERILDQGNVLRKNEKYIKNYYGYKKDAFKTLVENFEVLDNASDTAVDQRQFTKCFCSDHRSLMDDSKEKKKNIHRRKEEKYQLGKENTIQSELHENEMKSEKLSTPEISKAFVDSQFSMTKEVLSQIIEFSKLLPACLEVMSKMLNDSNERNQSENNSSYITSNRRVVPDNFLDILADSREKDCDKKNTSDNFFGTTSSQINFVRNLELNCENDSVFKTAIFEYVCGTVKATERLLQTVTAKGNNPLTDEKTTDYIFIPNGSSIETDEFEQNIDFLKDFEYKSEVSPLQMDQNDGHEFLEKKYSNNQREPDKRKSPWQFESNKEAQSFQIHSLCDSYYDLSKDLQQLFKDQIFDDNNRGVCPKIQQNTLLESEKYHEKWVSRERLIKMKDQNNDNLNESCSDKKFLNHSSLEIQKQLDDTSFMIRPQNNGHLSMSLSDPVISSHPCSDKESSNQTSKEIQNLLEDIDVMTSGQENRYLSMSSSDPVISSQSRQNIDINSLANTFFLEDGEMHQINEDDDLIFSLPSRIMQIPTNVRLPKKMERRHESAEDIRYKQKAGRLQKEIEHTDKGLFFLIDPQSINSNIEKEKKKNILNYHEILERKHTDDEHILHNSTRKESDIDNSPGTDEDIEENVQRILSDSQQFASINSDSNPCFISNPFIEHLTRSVPENKTSTGDLLHKKASQVYKKYSPRKLFRKKFGQIQDTKAGDLFNLLDPKRSHIGRKETSYKRLRTVDVGSGNIHDDLENKENAKLVAHNIYQATSKLQMRILKCRNIYKEALLKMGTNAGVKDLDDDWCDVGVPVIGRSWLRSYFTTRMIRRYQKQIETENIVDEVEDLATPMLKHRECSYGLGSYFSQRSLFGSVRMWYFSKKLREYQKELK